MTSGIRILRPSLHTWAEREKSSGTLGFLRTYRYLVQYESDFNIAIEKGLLPKMVTWEGFSRFTSDLRKIEDDDVTGRYAFGEIRLSRLNFYIKVILGKSRFHKVDGQYGTYFARFYGPILFVIGLASIVLNALQVEMAVESLHKNQWPRVWVLSRWTSVLTAILICLIAWILFLLLILRVSTEWYYACHDRRRKVAKVKGGGVQRQNYQR